LHLLGLTFRHIADDNPGPGEISGHFHPKIRISGESRPCFLIDRRRVILPAYGAYTGGLTPGHAALEALMDPRTVAVLTGSRTLVVPMRPG
jgi:metallophosphoesterase superfamily enzyme